MAAEPRDHLAFSQLNWTAVAPGARQKVFERDGKRVRLLELSRELVEDQWCHKGHIGLVLESVLELEFADRSERLDAGDGLLLVAGAAMKHKARGGRAGSCCSLSRMFES